jgi:glycosyltransferase involved in cell wall biosynthesis
MHILFLADNFPPEVNAPASRTFEHCREWVKQGYQATVVTCAPNFPAGQLLAGYKNRLWQTETVAGIRVIRVWSYIAANAGFVRRILDYVSFMATATIASLFVRRVDLVVGTSPQFFTVWAACAVSKLRRLPWVFELRDFWPESIRAVGAMRESAALRLLRRIEMALYRDADMIVPVTHAFRERLIERGIDARKIAVVTNGVDLSAFEPQPKSAEVVARLGLEGRFVAGYIGTHGMAHGLECLLDAAELLASDRRGRDVVVLLLGDGARKKHLVELAKQKGLANVVFVDSVPKSEVAAYWYVLDVSIIHLSRTELFSSVIPSKLFECMGMGIPVLHGVAGESAEIVLREGVGETFEAENAPQLVERLLGMRADVDRLARMRANCAAGARRYDRNQLARSMSGLLATLVRP